MRLFVSIDLPRELAASLAHVREELLRFPVSITPSEQLHATLCFIGESSESKAGEIVEKLKLVSFPRFFLKVKGIGAFPNAAKPHVVWAGLQAPELWKLSELIHSAIEIKPDKPFAGHVTIARVKHETNLSAITKRFSTVEFGAFQANSFKLMQSTLTAKGPVFTTLQEFSLPNP